MIYLGDLKFSLGNKKIVLLWNSCIVFGLKMFRNDYFMEASIILHL